MGKSRNKAVLSKAVSRYMVKHYKIIWVRREFHDKIRDAASKVGCSVPEFVYELFNRYGERLVEELLAERSKSAQATRHAETKRVEAPKVEATTRAPKPEVEVPEPGFVVIDLGVCGRFKIREGDWKLFVEIVESTRDPVTGSVLKRLPAHLRGLFKQMLMLPAVKYNVKAGVWMIDYSKFRIIRAH
jgi:hypothetical protein